MEDKNYVKINLFTIILVIIIIVIFIISFIMNKIAVTKEIVELKEDINNTKNTIKSLQEKVENFNNDNSSINNDEIGNVQDTNKKIETDDIEEIAINLFYEGANLINRMEYDDYYEYKTFEPLTQKTIDGNLYIKTIKLYDDVKKEYSNIFTEKLLEDVMSIRFYEEDGYLYVMAGGATGYDVGNIKVTQTSDINNKDEIDYTVRYRIILVDDSLTEEYSCNMTIKLTKDGYRILKTDYKNLTNQLKK